MPEDAGVEELIHLYYMLGHEMRLLMERLFVLKSNLSSSVEYDASVIGVIDDCYVVEFASKDFLKSFQQKAHCEELLVTDVDLASTNQAFKLLFDKIDIIVSLSCLVACVLCCCSRQLVVLPRTRGSCGIYYFQQ